MTDGDSMATADDSSPSDYVVATTFGTSVLLLEAGGKALRNGLSSAERRHARSTLTALRKLQRKRLALDASIRALPCSVRSKRKLKARLAALDEAAVGSVASLPLNGPWVDGMLKRVMDVVVKLECVEADLASISEAVCLPLRHVRKLGSLSDEARGRSAAVLHLSPTKWDRVVTEVLICDERARRCEQALLTDTSEIHLLGKCIRAINTWRAGRPGGAGLERREEHLHESTSTLPALRDEATLQQMVARYQTTRAVPLDVLCTLVPATAQPAEVDHVFTLLAQHAIEVFVPPGHHRAAEGLGAVSRADAEWGLPLHLVGSRVRDEGRLPLNEPGAAPTALVRLAVSRSSPRAVSVDLESIKRNLAGKADAVCISTSLPTRADRRAPAWLPRRVPLVARAAAVGASSPATADLASGATYADLGRLGESLVFAVMVKRWIAAGRGYANDLIRRIADEYWSCDRSSRGAIESILCSVSGEELFRHPVIRDLLWPSQTAYGDIFGFDVFGLDDDLRSWLCVEVKTTLGSPTTTFHWTSNEYARARHEGNRYALARVSRIHSEDVAVHIWRDPCALMSAGALVLTPESYLVSLGAGFEQAPHGKMISAS